MKTAMKELQDALEIYSRHNKGTQEGKEIDIILSAFPKFIEVEKEQIMEVVEFCDAHCDDGHFDKEGAIANIKSTFNL